jgi:hypothetical protein
MTLFAVIPAKARGSSAVRGTRYKFLDFSLFEIDRCAHAFCIPQCSVNGVSVRVCCAIRTMPEDKCVRVVFGVVGGEHEARFVCRAKSRI